MRKLGSLCAAALLGLPLSAMAEGLSYSFLEGGYVSTKADESDLEFDGWRAKLSVLINEGVYVLGGFSTIDSDENAAGAKTSLENITAGLGVRFGLFDATDLNIEGAWLNSKLEREGGVFDGAEVDDDGYTVGVGLRHLFFPQLEAGLKADYTDVADEDDFAYSASLQFHVIPMLSLGGSYTIADDSDTWTAGLRFNF